MRDVRDMETYVASQNAIEEIYRERRRQVDAEGWTPEHDDEHDDAELAVAGACYAMSAFLWRAGGGAFTTNQMAAYKARETLWPWDRQWWKPKDERSDLIKAGALIVAEIERLDRAAAKAASPLTPHVNYPEIPDSSTPHGGPCLHPPRGGPISPAMPDKPPPPPRFTDADRVPNGLAQSDNTPGMPGSYTPPEVEARMAKPKPVRRKGPWWKALNEREPPGGPR